MRALTVQQPWAWAIIWGGKTVENRTQAWSYRGPLVIHAGARWSEHGGHSRVVADAFVKDRQRRGIRGEPADYEGLLDAFVEVGIDQRLFHDRGVAIGVVDLVDVHHVVDSGGRVDCCDSAWAEPGQPGRWRVTHLVLENPRPLPVPIPAKGRLGLWHDVDLFGEVRRALRGVPA